MESFQSVLEKKVLSESCYNEIIARILKRKPEAHEIKRTNRQRETILKKHSQGPNNYSLGQNESGEEVLLGNKKKG